MSTDTQTGTGAPAAVPGEIAPRGDWALSWNGVRTVATLELRQRLRSTRWKIALVVWFVVVGGITLLTTGAVGLLSDSPGMDDPRTPLGPLVFGIVVFFVLFLGLLVAPTLSASAINGDRNAGTLATLQVTLLTAAEIVVGKLLAAWAAALAFLVASIPFIAFALVLGGLSVVALLSTLGLLAIMLGVVCAVGLGFSALTTKTSGSAVLTYLVVGGLSIVSVVLFGLTTPLVTVRDEPVRVWAPADTYDGLVEPTGSPQCEWRTEEQWVVHTERTWWLLAVNPFVVVADAAGSPVDDEFMGAADPLSGIRWAVREARSGPADEVDYCFDWYGNPVGDSPVAERVPDSSPVWPWGLGVNLLLGIGGVLVAVRRLRIPHRKLPRGTRVA
ncbi:ABC transporter permease [Oerskovia flava]|uniref:ABC transporter permease n=1 Tax=Oerskovia flava TaxID=2986422 RepID=UPI00223FA728|nr:ABC transporter permease [Oerskovia sp. JB1-3-2]